MTEPAWAEVEPDCPLLATHSALVEATYLMGLMGAHYHRPRLFLLHLNAAIQSLRNITFRLQAEKARVPSFDSWYEKQQNMMRANPLLRRFNEARTMVVHDIGLALRSRFISGVFSGRRMKIATGRNPPLMTDSVTELELLQRSSFGRRLAGGSERPAIGEQLGVERTWVVAELGDEEVLGLYVEALNVIGSIVSEAHAVVGSAYRHESIIADRWDRQEYQVLLETDVDPSLENRWGWTGGRVE